MKLTIATTRQLMSRSTIKSTSIIKPLLFLLLLFVLTFSSFAQTTKTIKGKITDDNGNGLPGVSVNVKNSNKGLITDVNGSFTIEAAEGAVLTISSVGYENGEIKIGKKDAYTLNLKSLSQSLNQVIVVGYGTQKRSTLTGAIASISSKTLNELPVPGIDQALQGRVSGLVVTNNGSPGSAPIISIRGISSVNGSADPLYVIDGFPTGNLNSFDSKDVESLEVLKDASAAAIYGSRATNGVILITTKRGRRNGKATVTFDSYAGLQSPAKKISLLNTSQYVQYAKALLGSTGTTLPPRLQDANFNLPIYAGSQQTFAQTNTDWQDAYFRKNALITQHNVSVSGGNETSRFYTSGGFFKQDGIAQGLGYQRGNFRMNSEHVISKVFTFGQTFYSAFSDQQYEGTGGNRSPLANVIRMQPYLPVRNPNNAGGFMGPISSFDGSDPTNPVEPAILNEYHIKSVKILATAYTEVNLSSFLKFRSTFGIDYTNANNTQYKPIFNDGGTSSATNAVINNERQLYTTLLFTQQLSFDKTYGQHHIGATAVYETQGQKYIDETASGTQTTNLVKTLTGASNITASSRNESNLIESYVGRLTYDFASKYLFSATIRRDGLSVWAPNHKYGNFPSASVGWRIDQENFMKPMKNISELKVRAGYGLTGLNPISLGNYPWEVSVHSNQSLYPFGGNPNAGQGSFYNQLGNTSLFWETTKQLNAGVDLGLFGNKFTLTAEYFSRQTDNLILGVPTPLSQGFLAAGVQSNVASMRNTGFEFQAGYHKTSGAFKWDVSGLVSFIKNKVISLNTPNAAIGAGGDADFGGGADITNTVAGQPVQSFYGWQTDGIFQSAAQVAASPTQSGAAAGDIKYKDLNGDGKITDADRKFLGSYLPKFTYSLNYSANYKNFDATIFFQGNQGNKIFNAQRILAEGMVRLFNSGTAVLNAWTPANTNTNVPRAINADPNQNVRPSDRWIEDGSYLRIKNLMFGYTFPAGALGTLTNGAITRFRVYVSSQNLATFTKYKGWDPEIGSRRTTLTNGIDYGQYPSSRSYQVGLQVGF